MAKTVKKAKWQNEKSAVDKVSKLRENIESTKNEIKSAQQNYDLEKAAELQYGVLPNLQKELEIEEQKIKDKDWMVTTSGASLHTSKFLRCRRTKPTR